MSMRYFSHYLLTCAAAIALGACADDNDSGVVAPDAQSDAICFGVSATQGWPDEAPKASRAGNKPADMGCYAFINSERALMIANRKYERNSLDIYTSEHNVYWPGAHTTLDFYNYAPYGAPGLEFDATFGSPSFAYTIPADAADRRDLLLASATGIEGNHNSALSLNFHHALTAVTFTVPAYDGLSVSEIKFAGLHCSGKATFDTAGKPQWTVADGAGTDEYTFTLGETNYLIPQKLDDATMTVSFTLNGEAHTVSAPLKTAARPEWLPGTAVNYSLNILPTLEVTSTPQVDAHFVLCRATVKIGRIAKGRQWTLKASATGGGSDPVTIQRMADVNQFAQAGYWTDKIMNDGVMSNESARGTAEITGTGGETVDVMIFVPENTTGADRDITLELTPQGDTAPAVTHTITQLCPDPNGWERIDEDGTGMYGFCYDAQHVLVYNTDNGYWNGLSKLIWLGFTDYYIDNVYKARYNATTGTGYVSKIDYSVRVQVGILPVTVDTYYLLIDYTKLNNLDGIAQSPTDGLQNTVELFNYGGPAVANTLETTLWGMTHWAGSGKVYRERINSDSDYNVPENEDGTNITANQALAIILKKNRYNIDRKKNGEEVSDAPRLEASNIVWYLPASGEFSDFGTWGDGTVTPANTWSSTALNTVSADGVKQAYNGAGSESERTAMLHVRARRAR